MSKPLEIYFEQTPNPDSLKLVTSKLLLPNIIIDRRLGEDTSDCPLATSLLKNLIGFREYLSQTISSL